MDMTPDRVRQELAEISARLDKLPASAAERADLEIRRADLRAVAQKVADATRNRAGLKQELEHLERRLREFDNEKIDIPTWRMAMATQNDSAAHAAKLNEALDAATASDRTAIEKRISRIRKAIAG